MMTSSEDSTLFNLPSKSLTVADRAKILQGLASKVDSFRNPKKWSRMPDGMVVVMPEGIGKSFLAVHLIRRRFRVVICCKSNAQVAAKADEIKNQWRANKEVLRLLQGTSPTVVRYKSREQHLSEVLCKMGLLATDFHLINYPTTSPYSPTTVDETSSVAALAAAFRTRGIDSDAAAIFSNHYSDYQPEQVNGSGVDIILMTLAAFQGLSTGIREVWWERLGLYSVTKAVEVTFENLDGLRMRDPSAQMGDDVRVPVPYERIAVIIDDPDRTDVDWLRHVSIDQADRLRKIRKPVTAAKERQEHSLYWRGLGIPMTSDRLAEIREDHKHPDGYSVHRLVDFKESTYVERPREQCIGFQLKRFGASPKLIITTTEYITGYYALQTLGRCGLHALDHLDVFHTADCNVTAVSTVITRKRNHALLLPIVEQLRREFPDEMLTLIADGLGCEFNLSNNKGRNDLANRATIVKLSWSHPAVVATVGAHFPDADNHDLLQACLLGDVCNQALGRNQGFRFQGRQAIVLVDSRWYKLLVENQLIRYELNPWSSALPTFNKRLSKKSLTLAFKVSSDQSLLEKRLLQLIADSESFGLSAAAAELMTSRPVREQKTFNAWLDSQSVEQPSLDEQATQKAHRRAQVAEAQRLFRKREKEKKAAGQKLGENS